MTDVVINNKDNNHLKSGKSLGGEDLFRGDGGYGNSIVSVAHQMISNGLVGRPGFLGHHKGHEEKKPPPTQPPRTRRGSKSLPASPISTPDSTPNIHRKNRYFTNPFVETDSADRYSKYPAGWLLAGVLGTQREAAGSRDTLDGSQLDLADSDVGKLQQLEVISNRTDSLRRNKSTSSMFAEHQENTSAVVTQTNVERPKKSNSPGQVARPKPSELRELNFWSPTSM